MDSRTEEVIEYRERIVQNVETLMKYAKQFQKDKEQGQMSLFSTETVEIDKPKLIKPQIDPLVQKNVLLQEVDKIGLSLLYDEFNKFTIIESALCTYKLHEIENHSEDITNGIMLVHINGIEPRFTKYGKKYAKLFVDRNGVRVKMYLFSDNYDEVIRDIYKGRIYLVKFNYESDNGTFVIKKISEASRIHYDKYIKKIIINMDKEKYQNMEYLKRIRNYLFTCKDNDGLDFSFRIKDDEYPMPYKIFLDYNDVEKIYEYECTINVERKV